MVRWEERAHQALTLKEDGNTRYRAGNYSGAISKYRQALTNLQGPNDTQPTDDQLDNINRLLVDCHNNLAGN